HLLSIFFTGWLYSFGVKVRLNNSPEIGLFVVKVNHLKSLPTQSQDIHPAVLVLFENLGDFSLTADIFHRLIVCVKQSKENSDLYALADHLLIPFCENMERKDHIRKQDHI